MATKTIKSALANGYDLGSYSHPEIRDFPEAASQSFVTGDLVYLTSNALTVCGADPAAILGFALAPASGTTGTMIPVWVIKGGHTYLMNVYHATATSATFSDNSGIDTAYEIASYAAGKWVVDISATSSTRGTIIAYESASEKGNIYMRVWFKFLIANLQFPY